MRRFLFLAALLVILISTLSFADETTLVHKIEFVTSDSLTMTGWLTPGSYNPPAPLIVLLHQYQSDHTSYDYFLNVLNQAYTRDTLHLLGAYPHTLALDIRGHGLSTKKGSKVVDYQKRDETEMKRIPSDVAFAINQVLSDSSLPVDTSKIFIVGASIGANAAAMATELIPYISKIVLLSPGEKYLGMEPTEALKNFKGKTLIYVSEGDDYSFKSTQKFKELNTERIEVRAFTKSLHGTEIINRHITSIRYMIDWLLAKPEVGR